MRLAVVSLMSGEQWGGSEALWYALALHALEQKATVLVSVYKWDTEHAKIKILREKGAVIAYRKRFDPQAGFVEKVKRTLVNRVPDLNKDYTAVTNFKPDAVFISQGSSFDLAVHHRPLYDLLREQQIPYAFVSHSHEQYSSIPEAVIYPGAVELFKNAAACYFVSQKHIAHTERMLVTKLTNARMTYNPMHLHAANMPVPAGKNSIVQFAIVGSLNGQKGHDTLLEVLNAPEWRTREWALNIYGTGHGMQYLEDLTMFYGLSEKVFFHGYVNDVKKIWEQNDILLIPSASEGLPISLTEAMACGRTCVAADVGGIAALITDGISGFIAAAPSVNSFSAALETAWSRRADWDAMGAAALQQFRTTVNTAPEKDIFQFLQNL